MPITRVYETVLPHPPETVWAFHDSVAALHALTPPNRKIEVVGDDLAVRDGALHVLRFHLFGLKMEWRARISDVRPPHQFVDTAEKSPFAAWRHLHEFLPHPEGTLLRDTVTYQPPGGPLARLADALVVRRDLDALFAFRHEATRRELARRVADPT